MLDDDPHPLVWPVSGASAPGLEGQAAQLAAFVRARPELSPVDVGWSLATTRTRLTHRAVVVGTDRDELLVGLDALAIARPASTVELGVARPGRLAVLFSGQGSQRPGMGRALHRRYPVFADTFDAVCADCGQTTLVPFKPCGDRPVYCSDCFSRRR